MVARLRIIGVDGYSRCHTLSSDPVLVGRMSACEINIGHDSQDVSRKHARLYREGDDWFVEDLGSRNHTYVNGLDIGVRSPRILQYGDRIRVCCYEMHFLDSDGPLHDSSSVRLHDTPITQAKSSVSLTSEVGPDDRTKLSALINVTQGLKNILSLDAVLADTLTALLRTFPTAQRGVIGLLEDNEFVPKWWKLRESNGQQSIGVSRTVIQHVINEKEAILLENAPKEFPDHLSITELSIQSLMCAPLLDADRNAIGAFQIDSESFAGFSRDDLVLMAAVAIQASLAISFARLHEHALQQQIIERDLKLARDVQGEFLPKSTPDIPGYEFADYYEPARFIGGDYFDYVPLANGKMAIVVGDVGGKGAPAALHMARMAMETRRCLLEFSDPAEVISELNLRLATRFATFVMYVLDTNSHSLTVVNAGHRPPLRRRADGTMESLGDLISRYPFGVEEDVQYESATYKLLPGETVSLLSDGFEDSYNAQRDEYFGIERIEAAITAAGDTAAVIVNELVRQVEEFSDGTMQIDDMCIVTISRAK